nr:adipocyte plasma membrane-associated protein-like [Lytechinus pictus]
MANTEGIRHRKPELTEDDGQNEPPKQMKRKMKKQGMMLPPPRPWTGALAPNNKLQKAQKLLEGKIIGPESLAYNKGRIYTGTYDGKVVEIKNDKDIKVIAQLGTPPCGTREDEIKCGRPLGIKFIGDKLYMIDAYYGLFEIDHKGRVE